MYPAHYQRISVLVLCVIWSACALADPPARVARLGYAAGAVSFSAAGEREWVQASLNRPLASGDRLWTDADGRAEVQAGGAMVRMDANTSLTLLNMDDRIAQLQITQGTLHVNVRYLGRDQLVEVNTPQLAFTLRQPGRYRIRVSPDGDATDIIVRKGQGEAYGTGIAYLVDGRQPYRFRDTGLRDYQVLATPAPDAFERWASARDRRLDNSASARYVSRDVVGYQDLDAHGRWRNDPAYGKVWVPNRKSAGWTPYRDGHWAWIDPWGWTWVDDAPWGYAVSHYGRWANMGGTWGWVPGPVRAPAVYAPAQVAFVGGDNMRVTVASALVGAVAWFALAPREVYHPPYQASREYNDRVNRSNTVINNTTLINNTTNITNINTVVYANQAIPGAVVAVPATIFVQSQPVARAAVPVSVEQLANRPAINRAAVVPSERSVHGGARAADKPPAPTLERVVIARTAPPPAHAGFVAQLAQLAQQPGRPLDDAARKALKPTPAAPAPVVTVLAAAQSAAPIAAPPPIARPAASSPVAAVATPATSAPVAPVIPPASAPSPAPGRSEPRLGPSQANKPGNPARPAVVPTPAAALPVAGASAATPLKPAAPSQAALPDAVPVPARAASAAPAVARVPASAPAPAAVRIPASAPAPAAVRVPASAPVPAVVRVPASAPALAVVRVPASAPVPAVVHIPAPPPLAQPPVGPKSSAPKVIVPALAVSAPPAAAPPKRGPFADQKVEVQAPEAAASAVVAAKPAARSSWARPANPKDEEVRLREDEKRKPKE